MRTGRPRPPDPWRRALQVGLPFAALAIALALIWQVSLAAVFGRGVAVSSQLDVAESAGGGSAPVALRERLPRAFRGLENPLEPTADHLAVGADLYGQHCAFCHGMGGDANTPAASGMKPRPEAFTGPDSHPMTDAKMFHRVTKGEARTGMPAWEAVLTETERWQVILYIRQMQQGPPG